MRRKRGKSEPAVRLPENVTYVMNRLAEATGWTESASLAFLATAGWNALQEKSSKVPSYQKLILAAVEHHETEASTRKKLAASSAKLRDAKKALSPPPNRR